MHTVAILHAPGCAGGRVALDIATRISQARPDVRVDDVVIQEEADAIATNFRGSPTVLIDGSDIEHDPQTPVGSMG